ncbi:MAG TPA: ABC transporter substrate-binding protein [Chloroflexota bacterium]|nr:ABC transporter substrate-binding protein [Chloroflexota bacterium]
MRYLILVALLLAGCSTAAQPTPSRPAGAPSPAGTAPAAQPPNSGGSQPGGSPSAGAAAVETVRVAHVPSTLFAPLYVAIEKGYVQEQGVKTQLEQVTAGQDAMALTAQGQLDAVVGGFAAATFNAIDRGLDLRVVGSMGAQPQSGYPSALMVRQDLLDSRQVQSIADLRGRKIAVAGGLGSTGSYWVANKLGEGGLGLRDVDVVNMPFPDMVTAFKASAVDAAFPPAPFTTEITKDGTAAYFGGPIRPGASAVGMVYGPAFRGERDATARRFFTALVRGARDLQGDGYFADEHLQIFAKYTNLPIETLRNIDAYGFDPDMKPDIDTLLDMQRVFFDAGILTFSPPLTADRIVDDSYSRAAVAQLGPYRR